MSTVTFPKERLARIAGREQSHFWHAPRQQLLLRLIDECVPADSTVLDVGCGTGALVAALVQRGRDASGIDPFADAAERGSPANGCRIRTGTAESLPLPDASIGALCAFDVIEHVDDDAAMHEFARVLRPGGVLLLSVPAHRWLWSHRDVRAGHRRRYTRRSLEALVARGGFHAEQVFGYQFLLLPLLVLGRALARRRADADTGIEDTPPAAANRILRLVNTAEVALGRWWRPPTGSSLVLVARLRAAPGRSARRT